MSDPTPTGEHQETAFRYSTFFSFKPDTPDWVRAEYVERWRAFILDCPQAQQAELNVPLQTVQPASFKQREFFSTIVFHTEADCDAYLNHPLHLSLHEELILPYADMANVFGGRYEYRPIR
jgi:hypothetical protein